ncbi:hypothetical protein [Actinoplanes sp. NPDC049681]|uniref:hypothetical protein n=1 Tax=Actinoplanes sp. NPDC049681 TaxID=3363905 RepID=UPI0037A1F477
MLQPLPGEADLAERECKALTSCAPDAANLVGHQLSLLRLTRTMAYASSWSVAILSTIVVAGATVLVIRERRDTLARFLAVAWKLQAGWGVGFLVALGVVLGLSANTLSGTPPAARMFTFSKAFDSPFTDAGHLYYLAWLIAVSAVAAATTQALQHSVTPR